MQLRIVLKEWRKKREVLQLARAADLRQYFERISTG